MNTLTVGYKELSHLDMRLYRTSGQLVGRYFDPTSTYQFHHCVRLDLKELEKVVENYGYIPE